MNRTRIVGRPLIVFVALSLCSCSTPIQSQKNTYSYLGRVIDRGTDVVTEPRSRVTNDPSAAVVDGMVRNPLASILHEALPNTKKVTYQQYTVALEQGEKLSLRSYSTDIEINECVRVWIVGPGVSPVYLYAPEQAAIERATECANAGQGRK
jgi:hypothetical protein